MRGRSRCRAARRNASALARALVRDPALLLLDEPFAALDVSTRIKMHQLVRELCERHQPAVLFVTHDVDEAILLADRILVMREGAIAVDLVVRLGQQRRRSDARFHALRVSLLSELGVVDDDVVVVHRNPHLPPRTPEELAR